MQERMNLIELGEEIKMAQDELLLNEKFVEYSFEQEEKNEDNKKSGPSFFGDLSKINYQHSEASSMFMGKNDLNFNQSNNQSLVLEPFLDSNSLRSTERRSSKLFEGFKHIGPENGVATFGSHQKNNDLPL